MLTTDEILPTSNYQAQFQFELDRKSRSIPKRTLGKQKNNQNQNKRTQSLQWSITCHPVSCNCQLGIDHFGHVVC